MIYCSNVFTVLG